MNPAATAMMPFYEGIAVPVAILTGDGDRIVQPATQSLALAARLPAARLIVVPGCGHMVHHTAPTAFAEAVAVVAQPKQ